MAQSCLNPCAFVIRNHKKWSELGILITEIDEEMQFQHVAPSPTHFSSFSVAWTFRCDHFQLSKTEVTTDLM